MVLVQVLMRYSENEVREGQFPENKHLQRWNLLEDLQVSKESRIKITYLISRPECSASSQVESSLGVLVSETNIWAGRQLDRLWEYVASLIKGSRQRKDLCKWSALLLGGILGSLQWRTEYSENHLLDSQTGEAYGFQVENVQYFTFYN